MSDPKRAEKLWLAIAVATLWLVSVGGKINTNLSASSLSLDHEADFLESIESKSISDTILNLKHDTSFSVGANGRSPLRLICSEYSLIWYDLKHSSFESNLGTRYLSCFRRGFLLILASVIKQMPLPTGHFAPQFFLDSG